MGFTDLFNQLYYSSHILQQERLNIVQFQELALLTWQSCYPGIVVCIMVLQYCFSDYKSEMFSFFKLDNMEK